MRKVDILVVGGGPGGLECARQLALKGRSVLLIEKARDFQENNYSSGGVPLSLIKEFSLPSSVVGSFWNKMTVRSKHETTSWSNGEPLGAVVDFDKLREFLSTEFVKSGGELLFGCHYLSHEEMDSSLLVKLKNKEAEFNVETLYLVDATGSERKVIKSNASELSHSVKFTGIEFHIDVTEAIYKQFDHTLSFFLGPHWMPQGYAWIFPMGHQKLKVGVVRYNQNSFNVPHEPSYQYYLDKVLDLCGEYKLLDRHGKTICYMPGQTDIKFKNRAIAIGDAISSINPLGCEGIRHAMVSGRIAAEELGMILNGNSASFKNYAARMKEYFGKKWMLSELLMKQIYGTQSDLRMDRIVNSFSLMTPEQAMDLIFSYHYRWLVRPMGHFLAERFKDRILGNN